MPEGRKPPSLSAVRQRMGGWSAGLDFAATAITCVLIGFGIDFFANTSPLFLMIFLVVGIVGGFTAFVRTAMRLNRGPKY
ncbi:MAG: AtpZ/AtpI family protein [Phycisphaeraceae bacterium]|nr:AtpZ/AtpI family protein [Phycisphaeraceae bacterium]